MVNSPVESANGEVKISNLGHRCKLVWIGKPKVDTPEND